MLGAVLPFRAAIRRGKQSKKPSQIREAIELCLEDMESRGEPLLAPNNVLIGSVLVNR